MAILKAPNVMPAYYNEIDPYAAQWIRNLITAGHIADGTVDERSIEDIHPIEIREFTQCHFFAGVGVWSRALRSAGWPDDRPVWTGSCPCQPFSSAGQGAGFADERHLWPAFNHLIAECRPSVVFGEQVASKDADPWIDLVHTDMEALGYAFGAVPFPSAGIGAPHIRDRLYWVADADYAGLEGGHRKHAYSQRRKETARHSGPCCAAGGLADPIGIRHTAIQRSSYSRLVDGANIQRPRVGFESGGAADRPSPTNGFWRDADWLLCRDGKWRPVEPGTFPLAHGAPARVGRLRAYGNAINAIQAQIFISAWLDCQP